VVAEHIDYGDVRNVPVAFMKMPNKKRLAHNSAEYPWILVGYANNANIHGEIRKNMNRLPAYHGFHRNRTLVRQGNPPC